MCCMISATCSQPPYPHRRAHRKGAAAGCHGCVPARAKCRRQRLSAWSCAAPGERACAGRPARCGAARPAAPRGAPPRRRRAPPGRALRAPRPFAPARFVSNYQRVRGTAPACWLVRVSAYKQPCMRMHARLCVRCNEPRRGRKENNTHIMHAPSSCSLAASQQGVARCACAWSAPDRAAAAPAHRRRRRRRRAAPWRRARPGRACARPPSRPAAPHTARCSCAAAARHSAQSKAPHCMCSSCTGIGTQCQDTQSAFTQRRGCVHCSCAPSSSRHRVFPWS